MPKLSVELVPASCWFSNVRSAVTRSEWDRIRNEVYAKAHDRCEVCGDDPDRLEAHEIWSYDDATKAQTLVGMIALCSRCHECKHIGLAGVRGNADRAVRHLAKVNGWSLQQADEYVDEQFHVWEARSQFRWTLDVQLLASYGIDLSKIKTREA